MSIILLIILIVICVNGVLIDDASFILLGLLFIGDGILIRRGWKW